MQARSFEDIPTDARDFGHIADLVLEVGVATRLLYGRCPATSAVMPLYQYIEDALHEIRDELIKTDRRPR